MFYNVTATGKKEEQNNQLLVLPKLGDNQLSSRLNLYLFLFIFLQFLTFYSISAKKNSEELKKYNIDSWAPFRGPWVLQ